MPTNTDPNYAAKSPTGRIVTLIDASTATGAGTARRPTGLDRMTFHATGWGIATVDIEVQIADSTLNSTHWIASGTQFTANGTGAVLGKFTGVRANVTAWSSGTPTITAII